MANLMDYLDWRGDLTLAVSPFNEVDALILAELSFVDFDGIVPPPEIGRGLPLCEAAEAFFARHGGRDVDMGVLVPDGISQMLRKLMASPRFRNMTLNGYTALLDDAVEQQFAALTIDLGNGSIYISFRGTDDTIVGWKEDLNMGFLEEIPSQKQSVAYVARMARQYPDKTIRIGGHSKGGNLAVYSAVKSDGAIQERIVAVHNNDGPGFAWDISETAGHKRIASRIHTVLPQTSVVGMLMEHENTIRSCIRPTTGSISTTAFPGRCWGRSLCISMMSPARGKSSMKRSLPGRIRSTPSSARRWPTRFTVYSPPRVQRRSVTSTRKSSKVLRRCSRPTKISTARPGAWSRRR